MEPNAELYAERVTADLKKYAYSIASRWFSDHSSDEIVHDLGKVFFAAHPRADSEPTHGAYHLAAAKLVCAREGGDPETLAVQRLVEADGLPMADVVRFLGLPKSRGVVAAEAEAEPDGRPALLTVERYIMGELTARELAHLEQTLKENREARARHDRVFKRRLLFLAETPLDEITQAVIELSTLTSSPVATRRTLKIPPSVIASGAVAAVVAFAVTYSTGARPETPQSAVGAPLAAAIEPEETEPEVVKMETPEVPPSEDDEPKPIPKPVPMKPVPMKPVAAAPTPVVPALESPDAQVSFWLYARGDSGVRRLEPGEEVATSEKIVPWVQVDKEGFAAVLGLREDGRVRVYYPANAPAERLVPGKTTRLGRAQSLEADPDTREQFALLWSPTRFDVAPVAAAARRGKHAVGTNFDGLVRWTDVRVRAEGVAAVQ